MIDYLVLDVSGTRYHLLKELIEKFPQSLLCQAIKPDYDYTGYVKKAKQNQFFIQRSPILFDNIILPVYISGTVHIPQWMCKETVKEELRFWQLDPSFCHSCAEHMPRYVITENETEDDRKNEIIRNDDNNSADKKKTIRQLLWELCEKPNSSKAALVNLHDTGTGVLKK